MSKSESVKMRTITITGPFGIDSDGDLYGLHECGDSHIYDAHSFMDNPKYTFTVENVRCILPTKQGVLIRATVECYGSRYDDQLLALQDTDDKPWRVLGGDLHNAWLGESEIIDWVELIPAQP